MTIDFKGRVAIVTGAGGGLGRQHALALAARGAKVLVNDLGGARDGSGHSLSAAESVVAEIRAAGGEAIANGASVTDWEAVQAMVQQAVETWGRIDIVVNNAGIVRDKSFAKMDLADFRLVLDVHLMGAAGTVIGPLFIIIAFFVAPFFGLAWAATQMFSKKTRQIPYGPFLSIGIVVVMIFHDGIINYLKVVFGR